MAHNIAAATNEDTQVIITLRASDIDSAAVTFTIVSGPNHGSLGLVSSPSCTSVPNGDGTLGSSCTATVTYTPAANYSGNDNFTYKVNDGSQDSNIATVAIAVTSVNDAPIANGQSVITNEDTTAAVVLSATDIDSQSLSFRIVTNPSKGTLQPDLGTELCSQRRRRELHRHGHLHPNSRPKRFGWFYFCR